MKTFKRFTIFLIVIAIFLSITSLSVTSQTTYNVSHLLGDADGDGEVTITDCTRIQRVIALIDSFSEGGTALADVDSDGTVCILDATLIQRWLAQLDVIVPIGRSVISPTVASEPPASTQPATQAPSVTPTTSPTLPTSEPSEATAPTVSQTEPPSASAKEICIQGVTFDVSKIKASYTLDDSNCSTGLTLILKPKSQVDPADITTVINDGNISNVIDYANPKFKESYLMSESSDILFGYDCQVNDSYGKNLAYVYAHYCGDKYYPYQTMVCGFEKASGSFPIEFYYKGQLIKRCMINVNISTNDSGLQSILSMTREIESKAWDGSMTDQQKMIAFARYVKEHLSYADVKCVEGALYTAFAARDLGLSSMLLYPGGEENQQCDYHIITYNLYQNAYIPGGHCACLVNYGDSVIRYDVQGGGYVIREYTY